MDLIAQYASESESEENPSKVRPEVPDPNRKKKKKKKKAANSASEAEILKKKEKKEKKKLFKKSLDQYPEKFDNHYVCNYCPMMLNRRSISRHMKNKHPEHVQLKWQYTVTKASFILDGSKLALVR